MKLPNLNKFRKKLNSKTFVRFFKPVKELIPEMPKQQSGCNKPIKFNVEDQLKSLIFYHLESFDSGRHLLDELNNDNFAKAVIAPEDGVKKSTFFDALNERGLEQFSFIFTALKAKAVNQLGTFYDEFGSCLYMCDKSFQF